MNDRGYGPYLFALIAIVFLAGSYAMWPPDFFSTPFAEMTFAMLLRAAASPVMALVGLQFLGALAIVLLTDS